MKNSNIASFPISTQAEQRLSRIQAEHMIKLTKVEIERILSFELEELDIQKRDQLRQYLEQSMLHGLMHVNYRIQFDTIRAIEYLARTISSSMRYDGQSFHTLIGDEVGLLKIPESDKIFLNFIYSLHKEDREFVENLYVVMSDCYTQRGTSIISPDANVTEDLRYLFIEIGGILELITESVTDTLEPYSVYR